MKYRVKRVDGKSPAFMIIVLFGYVCGICARLLDGIPSNDWLVAVYLIDINTPRPTRRNPRSDGLASANPSGAWKPRHASARHP